MSDKEITEKSIEAFDEECSKLTFDTDMLDFVEKLNGVIDSYDRKFRSINVYWSEDMFKSFLSSMECDLALFTPEFNKNPDPRKMTYLGLMGIKLTIHLKE